MSTSKTKVLLFCGGRGSKALINELLRRTDVDLTLMVNAYDDGLSTGALRKFIPGMLGPSDFRKNQSYLLELHSAEQYALQQIVEYRLPADFSAQDLKAFRKFILTQRTADLPAYLSKLFAALGTGKLAKVCESLKIFFAYYDTHQGNVDFEFRDCSVGNLIFAGLYLKVGQDFNKTIEALGALSDTRARLINVSRGEGYTLVGIKENGQILVSEGHIVGKQSPVRILDTFFISDPGQDVWDRLSTKTLEEKISWLKEHQLHPQLSAEAAEVLAQADVLIYGAGTQHSSLLPSYRIAQAAIAASPAKIKAFVVNVGHDHDIQGLSAADLVDEALKYMGDTQNSNKVITHILYHLSPKLDDSVLFENAALTEGVYKNAKLIQKNFVNPAKQTVHSGAAVIDAVLGLLEEESLGSKPELDIYIDLLGRSQASVSLLQEALELHWESVFSNVHLHIQKSLTENEQKLPPYIKVSILPKSSSAFESATFSMWMDSPKTSNYLVTLTGDGEYRLKDILSAANLLQTSSFAVVLGSRTQSRRQFLTSLRSAYGEGTFLYWLSWLGSFIITAFFGIRFGVVFSDPLTGFRMYRRDRLSPDLMNILRSKKYFNSVALTKHLLKAHVEIAEIPVSYKTFSGFTRPGWRFLRGLKSLMSLFG